MWRESGISGLPFYVGQGQHRKGGTHRQKYYRMYAKHREHVQWKWDKLINPVAEIHTDNLTKAEADELERLLILRLGRVDISTGILLNITEGADSNPVECDSVRTKLQKTTMANWKKSEYRNTVVNAIKESWNEDRKNTASIKVSERWKNSEYAENTKSKLIAIRNTENGKLQQSKNASQPVIYNGIEFASKKKLADFYGLDPVTCRKRLRLGIALDAPKDRGGKGKPKRKKNDSPI